MIQCISGFQGTLQEFLARNKDLADYQIIFPSVTLIKFQRGYYYGVELEDGSRHIVKCDQEKTKAFSPIFISDSAMPIGSINFKQILWEKTEEEMFKPDCCNG